MPTLIPTSIARFGRARTVSSITSSLGSMVEALRTHADAQEREAALIGERIERLSEEQHHAWDERERAVKTADKIAKLLA